MNKHIEQVIKKLGIKTPNFECPSIGQNPEELVFNLELLKKYQPGIIVEIGSAAGGHLYLMSCVLNGKHRIISIDTWAKGTEYSKLFPVYSVCIRKLQECFPNVLYEYIRGQSQEFITIRELESRLSGKPINFLFVDGSHDKDAVLKDWTNYSGFLDGIACFHDVIGDLGVASAWREITNNLQPGFETAVKNLRGIPLLEGHSQKVELGLGYIFNSNLSQTIKRRLQ